MVDNQEKFNSFRSEYTIFRFRSYAVTQSETEVILTYHFSIDNLAEFHPDIRIQKNQLNFKDISDDSNFRLLAFNIGLVELISYWKAACPPKIIIQCGNIDEKQIAWFKKLYYYGLGEFFYTNGITTNMQDFVTIECDSEESLTYTPKEFSLDGILIPIGGGKDSCVTLELLKDVEKKYCIMVTPKQVSLNCSQIAGFNDTNTVLIYRTFDKELIELNKRGFLNGHTPFSALLAFITYASSYLLNIKYIALSNESSANESNIPGEKINHQYSKSYEFENDFRQYVSNYLSPEIEYFSFLRPFSELQIAGLFSSYKHYHKMFKSCNVGSKQQDWHWCNTCAKCLFIFIILSPFLPEAELVEIFGENLFENVELLTTFIDLTGVSDVKPFECVGTFVEVNFALSKTISNLKDLGKKLPPLLHHYHENFMLSDGNHYLLEQYNETHHVPEELQKYLERGFYDIPKLN